VHLDNQCHEEHEEKHGWDKWETIIVHLQINDNNKDVAFVAGDERQPSLSPSPSNYCLLLLYCNNFFELMCIMSQRASQGCLEKGGLITEPRFCAKCGVWLGSEWETFLNLARESATDLALFVGSKYIMLR
jgi:hypothetical protein